MGKQGQRRKDVLKAGRVYPPRSDYPSPLHPAIPRRTRLRRAASVSPDMGNIRRLGVEEKRGERQYAKHIQAGGRTEKMARFQTAHFGAEANTGLDMPAGDSLGASPSCRRQRFNKVVVTRCHMIGKINPSLGKTRSERKEGEIDGVWKDDFAEGLRRTLRAYWRTSGIVPRDTRSRQKQ